MLINKLKQAIILVVPDKLFLKLMFKKHVGYGLDLSKPKSFNEKIQWLKIYDRKNLLTICADKYLVRDFVKGKIGEQYLIPLFNVYYNVEDMSEESFPEQPFIIKANHTSGTYRIFKNKKDLNISELKLLCKKWMSINYYNQTKEWQYKNIKPCIIIEKLLLNEDGVIPSDIKFSCFNGKVEIIHVDSNKEIKHYRNHYDRNWNSLNMRWPEEYDANILTPKPDLLEDLIILAETLAKDFIFVRVDFYVNDGCIYFGELTFHPTSGYGKFFPKSLDFEYGEKLSINKIL